MLSLLKIRNLALVESLSWEIGDGLVCVTGETGAGKSVIVGAVKLVLGERADRGLVRSGESSCSVEALFDLHAPEAINGLLEHAGLDPCDDGTLVIRRVIAASGSGNRQFINGSPCTLAVLKSLGEHLVDLHGPHDHQSLLSPDRQLAMLDAYAKAADTKSRFAAAFADWAKIDATYQSLLNAERSSAQEIDLLNFQISEIDDAALKDGEEEEIENRFRVATNAQRLVDESNAALSTVSEISSRFGTLKRHLSILNKTDPATSSLTDGAESAAVELAELEANLSDYLTRIDIDPSEAANLEERLDTIQSLKRKYGNTVDEILDHRAQAAEKLASIENRDDQLAMLAHEAEEALAKAQKLAAKLTQARKKAAPKLAADVATHLAELGFQQSVFTVALATRENDDLTTTGAESCEFIFAPNPGEPASPLRRTASSGEMSRIMLAVKRALVAEDQTPLLIFDEIDANVGGHIAEAVGHQMSALGQNHQVISITHLPQVAALASSHFVVTKNFGGDRTHALLTPVSGNNRTNEIARMLGGSPKSARAHAQNLLNHSP